MSSGPIKFYGNLICPFAQRALIVVKEHDVEHEYVHIKLGGEKPDWYYNVSSLAIFSSTSIKVRNCCQINPRGTVPAIEVGDQKIIESLIVAEYLDDAFGQDGKRLMPTDPMVFNRILHFDALG